MTIETLSADQYAIERAICDKAAAFWQANATFSKSGWSSMSAELSAHPDYAACDNDMRGRVEQFELTTNPPERFSAYVGAKRDHRGNDGPFYDLTTFAGNKLGTATIGAERRGRHDSTFQIYAWMSGREYTGRGGGSGMWANLRETAKSKRAKPRP